MYARQSEPIGLHGMSGLLDTIKDITKAGALTFLQYQEGKEEQKRRLAQMTAAQQEAEMARFRAAQTTVQTAGIGMPLIFGAIGLGAVWFFTRGKK